MKTREELKEIANTKRIANTISLIKLFEKGIEAAAAEGYDYYRASFSSVIDDKKFRAHFKELGFKVIINYGASDSNIEVQI